MPADSLTQIFDFEAGIESGVEAILETNITVGNLSIEKTRGTNNLTTPRIDVMLQMGPAQEHRFLWKGGYYFDAYAGLLLCSVITERDTNSNAHGIIRAQLRAFMQYGSQKFDRAGALPFHALRKIEEAGTAISFDKDNNEDISQLKFNLFIEIRVDAWPS